MNYKKPRITVITPTYDGPYLAGAIRSVLNQTYENIEYIISDDGSESFCAEEIENFVNSNESGSIVRFHIITHQKNIGTVKNLNGAIKASTGEYIFILADDDEFKDSHVLSEWVEEFQRTGAPVITAYREIYDDNFQVLIHRHPSSKQANMINRSSPMDLYRALCGSNFIFGSVTARTRASIDSYGLFDERFRNMEDYPMNLHLLRCGEAIKFWDRSAVMCRSNGISSPKRFNSIYERDSDLLMELGFLSFGQNARKSRATVQQVEKKAQKPSSI
jgi:glycosyltransferase involved in cell wall biosynthesis